MELNVSFTPSFLYYVFTMRRSIMKKYIYTTLALSLIFIGFSLKTSSAFAEMATAAETPVALFKAGTIEETHPPVKLTPDKSELIHLEKDAASIIVGNPFHLSVVMDNTKLLVLVAKEPGATHMTVLDKEGEIIMQRHVIVASPKQKYVRVRRNCAGGDDCQATSVYYCPGMCHEVILNTYDKQVESAELRDLNAEASFDEARANESNAKANATKRGE